VRLRPLIVALLLAGLAFSARAAELFGKPLRGLSPVSIAELHRKAASYEGRTIRIRGEVRTEGGAFHVAEGAASLRVTMRESGTALPKDADGASVAAEGTFRGKGPGGAPVLEATGLELTR
jgi:hypothetical protein